MARYRCVEQNLELIRRSGAWNPRIQRILKAAPLVVFFLLLNARSARSASCSFNPAPDPTVDGSPTSLRHAIQAANASGQDCLITLAKGTYTITIKNTNGHENDAAQGDLDIGDSGHTVTIQGQGAASSIVNGNKIDRVFDVLSGADASSKQLDDRGRNRAGRRYVRRTPRNHRRARRRDPGPRHGPGQSGGGNAQRESRAWGERCAGREFPRLPGV